MKTIAPIILMVLFISLISCNGKPKSGVKNTDETALQEKDTTQTEKSVLEKARDIHNNIIAIDTHDDIDVRNFTADRNYAQDLSTQITLPKMRKGGLDAAFFVVYTGQGPLTPEGYKKAYANADAKFKAIHRLTQEYAPDEIELATTAQEVRRIHKEGKLVALIGVENGYPIGEDLSKIKEFYDRGARYFSVAHNGNNQLGDSNTGEADGIWKNRGLSDLGKKVIAELNRLGIMIDLSHPAQSTNKQAIELSKAPVIASHSGVRALNDVSRNLWDEELEAIAKNGGVVQVVAVSSFVDKKKDNLHKAGERKILNQWAKKEGKKVIPWDRMNQMEDDSVMYYLQEYKELRELAGEQLEKEVNPIAPPVDVKDFVDHIDYIVQHIGIDHVGIASDFDGGGGIYGWDDASESFNLTLELVKRGYNEEEIRKIWGGNLLRVMEEVQQVAKEIQAQEKP